MTDRRRIEYEAPELGAMMSRMLVSLVRRATAGELEALEELQALTTRSRIALADAARGAHDGPGRYSWTDIGITLGISRQAARQLYGGPQSTDRGGRW